MYGYTRYLALCLIVLLLPACGVLDTDGDGAALEPEPLIVSDEQPSYALGRHLDILEDPNGDLTIEDVAGEAFDSRFSASDQDVPNYGFTDSVYWVRFDVANESVTNERWLLDVGFANMQYADLYTPLASGDGFAERQTGTFRAPSTRDVVHPDIVFELTVPAQTQETYYLRFQNGASMTLPLTLWEPSALANEFQVGLLLSGIFYGVMLGLLFYNLFLYFSLRELSYFYLALYLASMVVFEATYSGYLEVYLLPTFYYLKQYYMALAFALLFVAMVLFTVHFLETKRRLPRLHRVNILILAGWAVLMLLVPFTSYYVSASLMVPYALVTFAVVLLTGMVSWRAGFQPARFFLIAWVGLIVAFSMTVAVRSAWLESTVVTENAYRLGVMWMAVCWSIALADRISMLKEEAELANKDLQQSQQRLVQTLEAMPVGVVVYGPDQRPTYINERTAEILSNPQRELGPHPELARTLAEAMEYYAFRRGDSQEAYPLEAFPVYQALLGEPAHADDVEADLVDWRVPLEVWASPVFDEEGAVETAVVAFQDVSERKQAEMALRASERRFRAVVENNFDGIAFLDRERKILYVSPSFKRLNGLNAEEMVGKSGVDTIHPDDRSHVAEAFQELLEQPRGSVGAEYRIRHRDGSWVWVETRVMNLLDDPHVQAVVLNSRDITVRKTTEAELATYRQHLEQLVEERTRELEMINEQLSGEVAERTALEGLLYKRIEWMSAINAARQQIRGTADLRATYEELSETIQHLLEAGSVFLICWNGPAEEGELLCRLVSDIPEPDDEAIKSSLAKGSWLRSEIEQGKARMFAASEDDLIPAPMQALLKEGGGSSLLLLPMRGGDDVSGVLGLAVPQELHMLSAAQSELVSKITFDLAGLNEYATFLDQSRALVLVEERNRLARDLHDSVTQVLFSASLVAEVLPGLWERSPERALESLQELRRLTRGALAEMRTMLLELRPAALAKTPLDELLAQLAEASTTRTHLPFKLLIEKTPALPADVHATFYRVAQEALNNVAKHAQASEVVLSLRVVPAARPTNGRKAIDLTLDLEDDGVGFQPDEEQTGHLGLGIMRERAADIGASLTINSKPEQGTCVSLNWRGAVESNP